MLKRIHWVFTCVRAGRLRVFPNLFLFRFFTVMTQLFKCSFLVLALCSTVLVRGSVYTPMCKNTNTMIDVLLAVDTAQSMRRFVDNLKDILPVVAGDIGKIVGNLTVNRYGLVPFSTEQLHGAERIFSDPTKADILLSNNVETLQTRLRTVFYENTSVARDAFDALLLSMRAQNAGWRTSSRPSATGFPQHKQFIVVFTAAVPCSPKRTLPVYGSVTEWRKSDEDVLCGEKSAPNITELGFLLNQKDVYPAFILPYTDSTHKEALQNAYRSFAQRLGQGRIVGIPYTNASRTAFQPQIRIAIRDIVQSVLCSNHTVSSTRSMQESLSKNGTLLREELEVTKSTGYKPEKIGHSRDWELWFEAEKNNSTKSFETKNNTSIVNEQLDFGVEISSKPVHAAAENGFSETEDDDLDALLEDYGLNARTVTATKKPNTPVNVSRRHIRQLSEKADGSVLEHGNGRSKVSPEATHHCPSDDGLGYSVTEDEDLGAFLEDYGLNARTVTATKKPNTPVNVSRRPIRQLSEKADGSVLNGNGGSNVPPEATHHCPTDDGLGFSVTEDEDLGAFLEDHGLSARTVTATKKPNTPVNVSRRPIRQLSEKADGSVLKGPSEGSEIPPDRKKRYLSGDELSFPITKNDDFDAVVEEYDLNSPKATVTKTRRTRRKAIKSTGQTTDFEELTKFLEFSDEEVQFNSEVDCDDVTEFSVSSDDGDPDVSYDDVTPTSVMTEKPPTTRAATTIPEKGLTTGTTKSQTAPPDITASTEVINIKYTELTTSTTVTKAADYVFVYALVSSAVGVGVVAAGGLLYIMLRSKSLLGPLPDESYRSPVHVGTADREQVADTDRWDYT